MRQRWPATYAYIKMTLMGMRSLFAGCAPLPFIKAAMVVSLSLKTSSFAVRRTGTAHAAEICSKILTLASTKSLAISVPVFKELSKSSNTKASQYGRISAASIGFATYGSETARKSKSRVK